MLKRKFDAYECIFCFGDEEFAYIDTNQFDLCKTFNQTKENVAICFKAHQKPTSNYFTHIPLGCELDNPDTFISFLETRECGENIDFVKWKLLISYLGGSQQIMNDLKDLSYEAKDEISIVSAFYAFGTILKSLDTIEKVRHFTISLDRIEFFKGYGYDDLTFIKQVSPPLNIPSELLSQLNVDEIILNGLCIFPHICFVESNFANIIILNTPNQYANCKKICQILLDLKFVIVIESLVQWRCFPPFDKISHWNPIEITAVKHNKITNFVKDMTSFDHECYYIDSCTLITSVCLEYFVKTGLVFNEYPSETEISNKLNGIPIAKDVEFSETELNEVRFDILMQNGYNLQNFQSYLILNDVEEIPLPRHYLAEDDEEFCKSCKYDNEKETFQCVYPFAIRVLEELCIIHDKYKLVTISESSYYKDLCESLIELADQDICSSVAYIDTTSSTLDSNTWTHCNIIGIVNTPSNQSILTWKALP